MTVARLYERFLLMIRTNTSAMVIDELTPVQATQTIVIPVANPDTAPPLLHLAEKMMNEDNGRIILLYVETDSDKNRDGKVAIFRSMIESLDLSKQAYSLELVTRRAATIVDGILDISRHYHADMILLGLSYSIRGQVEPGRIVEKVIEKAPCDVGVFRSPKHSLVDRIMIPVGGSIASRVILNIGHRLSQGFQLPSEAVHVYSGTAEGEARAHVENLLAGIPDNETMAVKMIHGINAADSVLSQAHEQDLLVIGYSERSAIEKWLYGDTAQRILDRATGPVLLVSRAIDDSQVQSDVTRRLSWLRPLLSDTEQEHVVWLAKDTVLPTLDYFVLLVIAALLASLGLLLNSSAVVIGAMLVAPLMQPIIALGIGLCTARLNLMRKAIVTILLSVLVALGVGYLAGIFIAPDTATEEMFARAYPSLLDAMVALASGFIGAYATARKDIPAALAGVAIAAALVPPICTVGLSLALFEPRVAMGATLLFVANLISITVVGAGVFFWMGMRPTRLNNSTRRLRYAGVLVSIICIMLIVGGSLNYTHKPGVEIISQQRLQTLLEPAELRDLQIIRQDAGEPLIVVATVRTADEIPPESVRMAQVMLGEDLGTEVRLRIIVQRVLVAGTQGEIDTPAEIDN